MTTFREKVIELWPQVAVLFRVRRDRSKVAAVPALEEFVATRAAFVAQKTLFSYVKTRMGIRYPAMFADEKVNLSLNIAKMYVLAGCLSDLTIYAVGNALHDQPIPNAEREALARRCFAAGLRSHAEGAPAEFVPQDCIAAFDARLAATEWRAAARDPENFTASPAALLRWAPIADELKKFDSEIVANSIRFTWRDVREQFRKRIDAAAVSADWAAQTPA